MPPSAYLNLRGFTVGGTFLRGVFDKVRGHVQIHGGLRSLWRESCCLIAWPSIFTLPSCQRQMLDGPA
jgi:hypothetical protein